MRSRALDRVRGVVAVCGLLTFGAAVPSTAQGATYTVFSCATPGGAAIGGDGWQRASVTTATSWVLSLDCRSDGLSFSSGATTHLRGVELGIEFRPAAETTVVGLRLKHSVLMPGDQSNAWGWEYAVSAVDAGTGERFRWATCVMASTSCANHTSYEAEGIHTWGRRMSKVQVTAICSTMYAGNCPSWPAASIAVTSSAFTIEDRVSPEIVEPPTGSLINPSAPITGLAQVAVKAQDSGGGLMSATVEVDGVPVANGLLRYGHRPVHSAVLTSHALPCRCEQAALLRHCEDRRRHTFGPRTRDRRDRSELRDCWPVESHDAQSPAVRQSSRRDAVLPSTHHSAVASRCQSNRRERQRDVTLAGRIPPRLRVGVTRVVLFGDVPEGIRREVVPNKRGRFRARVAVRAAQRVRAAVMGASAAPMGVQQGTGDTAPLSHDS